MNREDVQQIIATALAVDCTYYGCCGEGDHILAARSIMAALEAAGETQWGTVSAGGHLYYFDRGGERMARRSASEHSTELVQRTVVGWHSEWETA